MKHLSNKMALSLKWLMPRNTTVCSCSIFFKNRYATLHNEKPIYTQEQILEFDDHRTAFWNKSNWELLRALLVLKACGSDLLVDNSLKLLRVGKDFLGERVLGWFLYPTIYSQFVAGNTGSELARTVRSLKDLGMKLMVAPCLEEDVGEGSSKQDKYDANLQEMIQLAELASKHGGRKACLQTKITAMLSADTLRRISCICAKGNESSWVQMVDNAASSMLNGSILPEIPGIINEDRENLALALQRFKVLGSIASEKSLTLLVDAEYSYMNPACSLVAMTMMTVFNQHEPVVANTYQCYFKNALQSLKLELSVVEALGACFAAKIVRGAYLEKERKLDPQTTCSSYAKTGENYDKVLEYALRYAKERGPQRNMILIATHNEMSVKNAVRYIHDLKLDPQAGNIVFAQIYGMAEQISMPLVKANYVVYKSVPMGSLNQVLPYLARRAAENRSVLHGARKERELLQKELGWRLKSAFQN